jgi:ABC-type antimicrobial peptide transport system permease subunit
MNGDHPGESRDDRRRSMITLKRAFRNILRNRFRTLLVGVVLALCVAVFVSVLAGVDASEAATAAMLAEYAEAAEATLEQTEQSMTQIMVMSGRGPFSGDSEEPMDEDIVAEVEAMDDVAAVVPAVTQGFGEPESGEEFHTGGGPGGGPGGPSVTFVRGADYMVYGVPLDPDLDEEYHVLPVSIAEGRSLEEGEDSAVLISSELTDYFGAGVGDTIDIDGTSFDVVGVYTSTMMQNQVYMSLDAAQDLLDMEGELSSLMVYADSVSAVDDVAAEIESAYPDFMVMAMADMQGGSGDFIQRQQEYITGTIDSNLASIQSLGIGTIAATGVVSVLLIFGLMFYTVRERTKEIGTLKALGFSNSDVMKQFMYEGSYIGLIGGAVGLGIAALAASGFASLILDPGGTLGTSVSVGLTLSATLLGLGVAVIAGALGSLYPSWRASRVSPMEALKHE